MNNIVEKLEDIRRYLDTDFHPVVSPDRWDVYASLCDMVDEIISLLKAQEPRVMTSTEVMDYVGYFEKNPPSEATTLPLWAESKEGTGVFTGYRNIDNIRNLIHMSGLDRSYIFNQHWRCWMARPTIEQMNNTPWEERDNGEKAEC